MALLPLGNITSANATMVLTVNALFPAGIPLQMFSTDQAVNMDEVTVAETRMGVDGNMVAGFVPSIKVVHINLEPPSPSYAALAELYRASEMKRGFYECTLVAHVPGVFRTFTWSRGVLTAGTILPPVNKLLEPTSWTFQFANLTITA